MKTTSNDYVRIDLWRYVKVENEEQRSLFRYITLLMNYIFYLVLIASTTAVILTNLKCGGKLGLFGIVVNILEIVIVSEILGENCTGDGVLTIIYLFWEHRYKRNDNELIIYDTKKSEKRETRPLVTFLYLLILFALTAFIVYILILGGPTAIANKVLLVAFYLDVYLFFYWLRHKSAIRRLNLIFGA